MSPYREQKPPSAGGLYSSGVQKLVILLMISVTTALLFFPHLTFTGYSYKPGDVAVTDIKSPADISSDGIVIRKGEAIVRDGQVIAESDIRKLDMVNSALRETVPLWPAIGFFVFSAILLLMNYYFAARNIRKFSSIPKDLLLMAVIFAGVTILVRFADTASLVMKGLFPAPAMVYKYMVPVAVGPMLIRLLLNSETALVFAAVTSIVTGFFMGGSLDLAAYSLIGGVAAAMGVRHCTQRTIIMRAGLMVGVVNAVTALSIAAVRGEFFSSQPLLLVMAGVINGVATAVLAMGVAPVLESAFQYTTNIRLLELSRMDHPLLKELAMRAPGTYHHSIVIGTLVEAAAESINANPLLARVAAYYHDIGKLRMPDYFIENIKGENRHDKLNPSMSALILTNHIKEGVDLARKYRLGQEIIDIINQHHGTSLISYFYQKAKAQEQPDMDEVDETHFRYPGPKPQTREAGLVMLADAIEAASKTIPDPSPDRIQWLTQKIVNKFFADGQLDECELTLKDLHAITNSFTRVFTGIYHQRIDYPEPAYIFKERDVEGSGQGRDGEDGGEGEGKKGGRGGLKRLGLQKL